MENVVASLKRLAGGIRNLEAQAARALAAGDKDAYLRLYREKCQLLVDYPQEVEPLLQGLAQAGEVRSMAESLASRAAQALDLDSPFYMYALLYPDDYQPGQPNELETFIGRLTATP